MSAAPTAEWLALCRRARDGLSQVLADHPTTAARVVETGDRGEGGDRTLVIDQLSEDFVFGLLDELHAAGHDFTAISEERGEADFGGGDVRVVIDPIDGSLNAKRGVPHHALSVGVADGPTIGDVFFGYVFDFGAGEEWVAHRDGGAYVDDVRLDPASLVERRTSTGKLEVVGIESADPRWVAQRIDGLVESVHRLRAMGTIAVTMCQVAGGRFDAMASLKGCRSVDAAAGALLVRESGGHVAFVGFDDPVGAPLDLVPHAPIVAARTADGLAQLSAVVS
jgi:myo-inositol-1(or 4)-monophosphatase